VPPAGLSIEDAARDTWERGYADALIVSGAATGAPASQSDVQRVKAAVADAFILIGSGLTAENAPALLQSADGAIVGSSLKIDGHAESRVSLDRVQRLVDVVRSIRT
jgi:predicted TIM-barrel enzyme